MIDWQILRSDEQPFLGLPGTIVTSPAAFQVFFLKPKALVKRPNRLDC